VPVSCAMSTSMPRSMLRRMTSCLLSLTRVEVVSIRASNSAGMEMGTGLFVFGFFLSLMIGMI
jgi:hypothetical protein